MALEIMHPATSLLGLPAELRLRIYEDLFDDLIEELSDNLFGVFHMCGNMYNYTGRHLDSHVGRTGLTPILSTCRQIYNEALPILCNKATYLVNVVGDDDDDDKDRALLRIPDESQARLTLARDMRVNLLPQDEASMDRFIDRMHKFLRTIGYGSELRTLEIFLEPQSEFGLPCGMQPVTSDSLDRVLNVLATLRKQGAQTLVYLGDIKEDSLTNDRLNLLLDAINGRDKGRGNEALEPNHYVLDSPSDDGPWCLYHRSSNSDSESIYEDVGEEESMHGSVPEDNETT